jgi:hypothetical protein
MTRFLIFAPLLLLNLTGCVAALPMVAQLVSSPNSASQLCSFTKLPGQTESLCDRMQIGSTAQNSTAQNSTAQTPTRVATTNTPVR